MELSLTRIDSLFALSETTNAPTMVKIMSFSSNLFEICEKVNTFFFVNVAKVIGDCFSLQDHQSICVIRVYNPSVESDYLKI